MVVVLWQNWGEHVGRQLPHFLSAATLTDVTITVGPRSVRAHRIILAFFSPFFKRMLEEVSEERPMVVVFPGVNYDALQVIIAYMYRGQVNVPSELLSHVIELAKMLQVKGLIELPSQLDSVIASAGSKVGRGQEHHTHLDTTGEESAELCVEGEAEDMVELEVTEGEPHPTVSTPSTVSTTTTATTPLHHSQRHTTTVTPPSPPPPPPPPPLQQQQKQQESHPAGTTGTAKGEEVSPGHVLIRPEDIQLSTVDDLAPTHIIKLNEDGTMGEMWFGEGYISAPPQAPPPPSNQDPPSTHSTTAEEENVALQDDQPDKKKRKVIYKLTRYGPEDLQRALEDVRSGTGTLREIAGRWGVPHSTLSVNARLAGIAQHQRSLDYNAQTLEAAKEAVRAGASYMKVARRYNIPKSVLWRRCQREVGARRSGGVGGGGVGAGYTYSQRELSAARQMLLEGGSLSHIMKETKIPKTTLFRLKEQLVREGRMPASSITRLPRLRRPPEESLRKAVAACKDEGLSQGQASEKFQVSKSTVWRRLKRLKQESSSGSDSLEAEQQRVKIEVVETLPAEALDHHFHGEVTVEYSDDSGLKYVDAVEEEEEEGTRVRDYVEEEATRGRGYEEVVEENTRGRGYVEDEGTSGRGYEEERKFGATAGGEKCVVGGGGEGDIGGTKVKEKVQVVVGMRDNTKVDNHVDVVGMRAGTRVSDDKVQVVGIQAGKSDRKVEVVGLQGAKLDDKTDAVGLQNTKLVRKVEVVAESPLVMATGPPGGHLGILEEGGPLTMAQGSKVMGEAGEGSTSQRFELEMPLVNLPGGGYQVVGSEIVIGGQQVVVIEPGPSSHRSLASHHTT